MADEPISGLPAAVLPLTGAELIAVTQSGVTKEAALSAIGASGETICTSATRPSTPFFGQQIVETDTGRVLYWYGNTTGWQPDWSVGWGELTGGFTANPGPINDVANTEVTILACGAVSVVQNRKIVVHFHAPSISGENSITYGKFFVADHANNHLALLFRGQFPNGLDAAGQANSVGYDWEAELTGVSGSFQPNIRLNYPGSSGAIRIGVSNTVDPGPIWASIRDIGPAGPPA